MKFKPKAEDSLIMYKPALLPSFLTPHQNIGKPIQSMKRSNARKELFYHSQDIIKMAAVSEAPKPPYSLTEVSSKIEWGLYSKENDWEPLPSAIQLDTLINVGLRFEVLDMTGVKNWANDLTGAELELEPAGHLEIFQFGGADASVEPLTNGRLQVDSKWGNVNITGSGGTAQEECRFTTNIAGEPSKPPSFGVGSEDIDGYHYLNNYQTHSGLDNSSGSD